MLFVREIMLEDDNMCTDFRYIYNNWSIRIKNPSQLNMFVGLAKTAKSVFSPTSSSSLAASGMRESWVEDDVGSLGGGVMERLFPPFSRKRRLSSSGVMPENIWEIEFQL